MRVVLKGVNGCQPDILSGNNERFRRCLRILEQDDFKRVFACPIKSIDGNFTVLATDNSLTHPRLGLAIAKKQVKTSVARNRIKRVVRDSFRLYQNNLPALDIVVLVRQGIAEKDKTALHCSMQRHWRRICRKCEK